MLAGLKDLLQVLNHPLSSILTAEGEKKKMLWSLLHWTSNPPQWLPGLERLELTDLHLDWLDGEGLDGWLDGWVTGWLVEWMDGLTAGQMAGWLDGWPDGWVAGWIVG